MLFNATPVGVRLLIISTHMCLYPKRILNKKYLPNKKNGGVPPVCQDERMLYVEVGCGVCIECMQEKQREWQVRMYEEIKTYTNGKYVTLTFSEEALEKLCTEFGETESNIIAQKAVRRFLERWRKKYKKSVRHWLITELGHQNTERIHLHGILFTDNEQDIEPIWGYGNVKIGEYVNNQTINYIIKYCSKIDQDHKNYRPIVLCSPGIGKEYLSEPIKKIHGFKDNETKSYYITATGHKIAQPAYYKKKLYNDEQRESLWANMMDKEVTYIRGREYDNRNEKLIRKAYAEAQQENIQLGYGSREKEWKKKPYNVTKQLRQKEQAITDYYAMRYDLKKREEFLKKWEKMNKR